MSPYYRDILPLKTYTHCVLKNCLDFVMSITKCLFFRGSLATPFFRESIQNRRDPIPHPMLLLLLCFSRGKHTFKS